MRGPSILITALYHVVGRMIILSLLPFATLKHNDPNLVVTKFVSQ